MFHHNDTSSPRWKKTRTIDHEFEEKYNFLTLSISNTLTLSISNNQLKCCSTVDGSIKVYSLSGELLQTHGARGRAESGQLCGPHISDDDDDGSVLIADYGNDRLQVMSEQGEFSVLQLQPPVSHTRSAVLLNNHMFVTSAVNKKTIYKYSC